MMRPIVSPGMQDEGYVRLFDLPDTRYRPEVLDRLGFEMRLFPTSSVGKIPAGYVYLGQFLVHDITRLVRPEEPYRPVGELRQAQTSALDLSSVYGLPGQEYTIPREPHTGKLRLGHSLDTRDQAIPGGDLPRDPRTLIALIGDDRNDENLIVAQLHLQFLKFHNFFAGQISRKFNVEPERVFLEAKTELILHFQHMILYDFLQRVLDDSVWKTVVLDGEYHLLEAFSGEMPRLPIEFSAAAMRFGHSMVRSTYNLNSSIRGISIEDLFRLTGATRFSNRTGLPDTHVIDWSEFFDVDPSRRSQKARPISESVRVRIPAGRAPAEYLAVKNLRSGNQSGLPCAQAVVRHLLGRSPGLGQSIGLRELSAREIDYLQPSQRGFLSEYLGRDAPAIIHKTPLWYYILAEARCFHGGVKLGPLGSLMVAETLCLLVRLSRPSLFDYPNWVSSHVGGGHIPGRQKTESVLNCLLSQVN